MTSEAEAQDQRTESAAREPSPPVFGTWRRFYLVVILNTLFLYLLLLLFSRFAR